METTTRKDAWSAGDLYEPYVGRWSRRVAQEFVGWLGVPPGRDWVDVGCGTGALTETIATTSAPRSVLGVDPSEAFLAHARERVSATAVHFEVGDAQALPLDSGSVDVAVAGLVLNFVPRPARAIAEMARVARPGGVVAVYVWDYAGKMELMRHFWDAAVALDPAAGPLDEGRRFPICEPDALAGLLREGGLDQVEARAIEVPTAFRDFDDYWSPFLGGQGPAPGYAVSLDEERRAALREHIRSRLPIAEDGSISLAARAWATRGLKR